MAERVSIARVEIVFDVVFSFRKAMSPAMPRMRRRRVSSGGLDGMVADRQSIVGSTGINGGPVQLQAQHLHALGFLEQLVVDPEVGRHVSCSTQWIVWSKLGPKLTERAVG